jgi:hypothetical protein
MKYITKFNYFKVLLFIVAGLYIYSLWQRDADIDDAWIGEYAYWLAEDGYVHSELMRGVNKQEVNFVVHHKLFNFHGAFFVEIFGFSLYSLKSVSLLYFIAFLLIFYYYTCKWNRIFNKSDYLLVLIVFFSFPWIFKYAFLYRPEIMMMTLGFIGYILLEKSITKKKKPSGILLVSGMFFGLSAAAHLNGIILITSGGLLLLFNKKYRDVIVFGLGVLFTFSIYFYDLTDMDSFTLWKHQFFESPSLDSLQAGSPWLKPIINLLGEHMRYFHNLQIIIFSVFFFSTLFVGFNYLLKNHRLLLQFVIIMGVIMGVIAMHKSRQYLLLNFPYMVMLIVLTIKTLREGKIQSFKIGNRKQVSGLIVVLFIIFIAVSFYYNFELAIQKFTPEQNRELTLKYGGENASELKIVAPMTFIFNEIEHLNQIQGDLCYIELQKLDSTIYGEGFLKSANDFDRDLIMVSSKYQDALGITNYKAGDEFEYYYVLDKTEDLVVFKRKNAYKF